MADDVDYAALIDSPEAAAFVGAKAETYADKWRKMWSKRPNPKTVEATPSWNWAAFFFTCFWLFYRKIWLAGSVFLGLALAVGMMAALWAPDAPLTTFGVVMSGACGMLGNGMYLAHVRAKVKQAQASHPDMEARLGALKAQGGTSWPAGVGAFVAFLVLTGAGAGVTEMVSPYNTRLAEVSGTWATPYAEIIDLDLTSLSPSETRDGVRWDVGNTQVEDGGDTVSYTVSNGDGVSHVRVLHFKWTPDGVSYALDLEEEDGTVLPLYPVLQPGE